MRNPIVFSRERWLQLVGATALVLALMLSGAAGSRAAWPGTNGPVVFVGARPNGEDGQVRTGLWSFEVGKAGTVRQLSTDDSDRQPQISPSGHTVVFVRNVENGGSGTAIFLMESDNTNVRQLTHPSLGEADSCPAFDAAGKRVVFARGGDLYLVGLDGSGLRQLTSGAPIDRDPAFSPKGRQLAFARSDFRLKGGRRTEVQHIFSMRPNGSHLRDLIADSSVSQAQSPDFSPDGLTIVFAEGLSDASELFTMRSNGSDLHRLARVGLEAKGLVEPAFSPSGETIVAAAKDKYGSSLVRVSTKGKRRVQGFGQAPYGSEPVWGPGG